MVSRCDGQQTGRGECGDVGHHGHVGGAGGLGLGVVMGRAGGGGG